MPGERLSSSATGSTATAGADSSKNGKQKKTKLEKIAELESSLKLVKEENRKLRKDMHLLKQGVHGHPPNGHGDSHSHNNTVAQIGDVEKMKDALKALKRVTVNQELSLQNLRTKANQRRKELKEKDAMIASLQKQVRSLQRTQHALTSGGGDQMKKLEELQQACFEEEKKNMKLEATVHELEAAKNRLQKQLEQAGNGLLLRRTASNHSMKSMESVSTTQELDLARMKKELASKSNKIVQLEMDMELARDELHELQQEKQKWLAQQQQQQQQKQKSGMDAKNGFPADTFMQPDGKDLFGDFTFHSVDPFERCGGDDDNKNSNDDDSDSTIDEDEEQDFW